MTLGNLPKNVAGLAIYFPILVVNSYADRIARVTERWLNWFESDELVPNGDGPVDGDSTDPLGDLELTHEEKNFVNKIIDATAREKPHG